MQFYDATNKRAICQEIDRLCDTSDTSYPRLDKTARVNDSMEELVGDIIAADGTWQYDDTNYTTIPRGKGLLVEGQQQYAFAAEYLDIEEVDILDTGSRYVRIKPLDPRELGGLSPEEYFGVDSSGNPSKGFPRYYDKQGDSIYLWPAPTSASVTLTNGIRVTFRRAPVAFTAVSTTAADTTEPGLPSSYHIILPYMASLPYCMAYKKDRVVLYQARVQELKKKLLAYYGLREKDKRKIMTMAPIDYW